MTWDLAETMKGADCAAIVTWHRAYLDMAVEQVRSLMKMLVVVDGRNVFESEICGQNGIGIGEQAKGGSQQIEC